jgi:Zn-dependent protease with chaperone function
MSKWMAKKSVGAQVITDPRTPEELWLVQTVARQAQAAGIKMPEVAIFDSPDVNAFATGMSKNSSLIAVSTGLLRGMTRDEAEAVLGHEVSHAANGDMVTLALIQGVVNTFVMFFSRVIGHLVDRVVFKTERGQGPAFFVTMIIAELVWASWPPSSSCGSRASANSAPTRAAPAWPGARSHDRRPEALQASMSPPPCPRRWRPSASTAARRRPEARCS